MHLQRWLLAVGFGQHSRLHSMCRWLDVDGGCRDLHCVCRQHVRSGGGLELVLQLSLEQRLRGWAECVRV